MFAESENPLQARAIHPAGSPGVPSPSPPPNVGTLGVNIGGYSVWLYLVAMNTRAPARMMYGAQ